MTGQNFLGEAHQAGIASQYSFPVASRRQPTEYMHNLLYDNSSINSSQLTVQETENFVHAPSSHLHWMTRHHGDDHLHFPEGYLSSGTPSSDAMVSSLLLLTFSLPFRFRVQKTTEGKDPTGV